MKRIIAWISLALLMVTLFAPLNISAAGGTEYMDDGSYLVITTTEFAARTPGAKTVWTDYQYYSANHILEWTATLTATFIYNDITSECTYATLDVDIFADEWYLVSENTRPDMDTAISDFTMGKRYVGITTSKYPYTLTILCEPDGTIY